MTSHTGGRALCRALGAVVSDEELELGGRGRDHVGRIDEREGLESLSERYGVVGPWEALAVLYGQQRGR